MSPAPTPQQAQLPVVPPWTTQGPGPRVATDNNPPKSAGAPNAAKAWAIQLQQYKQRHQWTTSILLHSRGTTVGHSCLLILVLTQTCQATTFTRREGIGTMTGPTPTPITPQPPTIVPATGTPPGDADALPPGPASVNAATAQAIQQVADGVGRKDARGKTNGKGKAIKQSQSQSQNNNKRMDSTLDPVPTTAATTTRKGGDITGTTQGPGVAPAQTIPIRLRELQKHSGQQAKVADGVGRKHTRGKTNGKGKAIKQSQRQNNNKSKRQAPEEVKAAFILTPENTSALEGTTAHFNCTADGADTITYLVNNMSLAALTSLGIQLSEHDSWTSVYLDVRVTRNMTNWSVVCIAYLPNETRVDSLQPTFMCKLLLLLLNI